MADPTNFALDQYGDPTGRPVFYFHGAPGFAGECAQFDLIAQEAGVLLFAVHRFDRAPDLDFDTYIEELAVFLGAYAKSAPMEFIGFSLGAFIALMVAAKMKQPPARIYLISPAAPLETGDYLSLMAGALVFKMARAPVFVFRLFSMLQAIGVTIAPDIFYHQLFGNATGAEGALAREPNFRLEIDAALQFSVQQAVAGYVREMHAYVRPWAHRVLGLGTKVIIYHGADDHWAPAIMGTNLGKLLPDTRAVHILPNLAHYSCRQVTMEKILRSHL